MARNVPNNIYKQLFISLLISNLLKTRVRIIEDVLLRGPKRVSESGRNVLEYFPVTSVKRFRNNGIISNYRSESEVVSCGIFCLSSLNLINNKKVCN